MNTYRFFCIHIYFLVGFSFTICRKFGLIPGVKGLLLTAYLNPPIHYIINYNDMSIVGL